MNAPITLPGEVTITCHSIAFIEAFVAHADRRRECLRAERPAMDHLIGVAIRDVYVRRQTRTHQKPKRGGATAYRHAAER